jgi:hypothetical protein
MGAMLSTDAAMIQAQHIDGRQEPKQEHESLPRLCLGSERALDVQPLAPPRHLRCVEHGLLNEGFAAFGTFWASPFAAPRLLRASRGRALYRTCRHRYRPVQQAMSLRSAMLWIDVRLQRTLKNQRSSRSSVRVSRIGHSEPNSRWCLLQDLLNQPCRARSLGRISRSRLRGRAPRRC